MNVDLTSDRWTSGSAGGSEVQNFKLLRGGSMSLSELIRMNVSVCSGFQVNSAVVQEVVSHYADVTFSIDFDCFISCLIRLEMLFSECQLYRQTLVTRFADKVC